MTIAQGEVQTRIIVIGFSHADVMRFMAHKLIVLTTETNPEIPSEWAVVLAYEENADAIANLVKTIEPEDLQAAAS